MPKNATTKTGKHTTMGIWPDLRKWLRRPKQRPDLREADGRLLPADGGFVLGAQATGTGGHGAQRVQLRFQFGYPAR